MLRHSILLTPQNLSAAGQYVGTRSMRELTRCRAEVRRAVGFAINDAACGLAANE